MKHYFSLLKFIPLVMVFILVEAHAMLQEEATSSGGFESLLARSMQKGIVEGRKLNLLMDLIAPDWSLFAIELGQREKEIQLLSGNVKEEWNMSYLNFSTDTLKSRRMLQSWEAYQESVDPEKLINILRKLGKKDSAVTYQQRISANKIREPSSPTAKLATSDVGKIQLSDETIKNLSREIGNDWFEFAMMLDLRFFDVENIIHGHDVKNLKHNKNGEPVKTLKNAYQKCEAVFKLWAREGNTSKKILSQALVDIDREDLVELIYPKPIIRPAINELNQAMKPYDQSVSNKELKTLSLKVTAFWSLYVALLGVPQDDIKEIESNHSYYPEDMAYQGLRLAKKTGVLDNVDISALIEMAENTSLYNQYESLTLTDALKKLEGDKSDEPVECPMCFERPNVVPKCGHACCASCLLKNTTYGRNECPTCQKIIDPKTIIKLY